MTDETIKIDGSWTATSRSAYLGDVWEIKDDDGEIVVADDCGYAAKSEEQKRQYAHIIAAAPDMYRALNVLLWECFNAGGVESEGERLARKALSKAEGRSK